MKAKVFMQRPKNVLGLISRYHRIAKGMLLASVDMHFFKKKKTIGAICWWAYNAPHTIQP